MVKWLRNSHISSIILVLFRLYVGYTFLSHGWQKISGGFDPSEFLQGLIKNPGVERRRLYFIQSRFEPLLN